MRKGAKCRVLNVAAKALDGLHNAASFQVERGPVPLGLESSAADISDGQHGAVRLLLFERSIKTVDSRVAAHAEGA